MRRCQCGCRRVIPPKRWHRWTKPRFIDGGHAAAFDARIGKGRRQYIPKRSEIPSGQCECGCGRRTTRAVATERSRRHFLGHPMPYLPGHSPARRGSASHKWTGGRLVTPSGYIRVYAPDHPNAQKGYVLEHRLVLERVLGRRLRRDEHGHHINGDKADNRPENLRAMSATEHTLLHNVGKVPPRRRPRSA